MGDISDDIGTPEADAAPETAWPPAEIGGVPLLNPALCPARSKPWGCGGCKLFQYSPTFTAQDREAYHAKLDPERRSKKNASYQLEGRGPARARVMVVLEEPSRDEDKTGQTASGGAARWVKALLGQVGGQPSAYHWTYLLKCRSPEGVKIDMRAAAYCSKFLAQEVLTVEPEVIVALGGLATRALLGKQDASVLQYHGVPTRVAVAGRPVVVYPLWSPGYVNRNDWLAPKYARAIQGLVDFLDGKRAVLEDSSLYELVDTPQAAIDLCRWILAAIEDNPRVKVEVDLETSGLNPYLRGQRISVVSLCVDRKRGYAIPYNHDERPWTDDDRTRFVVEGLRPLLQHPAVLLRAHNGKFDWQWIREHMGFWPRDLVEDTMLSHYASDENIEHGLKPLSLRYTDMGDYDRELDEYLKAHFPSDAPRYDKVPWELVGKYAGMDTVATRKLAQALRQQIADQRDPAIEALAYRALPAYSAALTRMEYAGLRVDMGFGEAAVPVFQENERKSLEAIESEPVVRQFMRDKELEARQERVASWKVPPEGSKRRRKTIDDLPGEDEKRFFKFSLDSPLQLRELLFSSKYYGHEVVGYSEKGEPSTDKETMAELATLGSPIAKRIVEYRLDTKLLSSYLLPVIETCRGQAEPVLHTHALVHGTKTGRLSMKDPNLQATPNKGAGYIKRLFVSRYGEDGCIVQADYSQIELRILACVSGDRGMIDAFIRDDDLHVLTALLLMDLTIEQYNALPDEDKKTFRTIAKRINFGIPYGVAGPGISGMLAGEGIKRDADTCEGYIDKFFREKPKVQTWIDRVQASTVEDTISRSLFGRHRRLEQVRSRINSVVNRAQRQSINHPIQSTAADMTMSSLVHDGPGGRPARRRRGAAPALPDHRPRRLRRDAGLGPGAHRAHGARQHRFRLPPLHGGRRGGDVPARHAEHRRPGAPHLGRRRRPQPGLPQAGADARRHRGRVQLPRRGGREGSVRR